MKEATGELNATVVVVITIGILSTFFFTIIWPSLKSNLNKNTKCSDAICSAKRLKDGKIQNCAEYQNGTCVKLNCKYKGDTLTCPFKG